jgi:hypothetical protein
MPLLTAAVRGDFRAAIEAKVRDAARARRRGVELAAAKCRSRTGARAASKRSPQRSPLAIDTSHQPWHCDPVWLPPVQNRLDDVGRQQRQPQQARDFGRA